VFVFPICKLSINPLLNVLISQQRLEVLAISYPDQTNELFQELVSNLVSCYLFHLLVVIESTFRSVIELHVQKVNGEVTIFAE